MPKKKTEKKKNKNKGVFNELSETFLFIYNVYFFKLNKLSTYIGILTRLHKETRKAYLINMLLPTLKNAIINGNKNLENVVISGYKIIMNNA